MKPLISPILVLIAFLSVAKADSLTNGLVAHYKFEGNANDESGNSNHATPAGNYIYVTNDFTGGAIRIIGDNSQFYAGGGHVMLPAFTTNLNSGFTCSLWVRDEVPGTGASDAENYVFFASSPAAGPKAWISLNNWNPPFVGFLVGDGNAQAFNPWHYINLSTYPANWKHLAIVSAPDKFACYLNGTKIFQTNVSYNLFPAPYSALGRTWWQSGTSARMSCTYDNVRIYSRVLADQEIQELFNSEPGPRVALIRAVKPSLLYLTVGTNYQLQLSSDLQNWTNHSSPFVATNTTMIYPQYWDADTGSLFFRLKVAP